jgi:hypothetical protein
VPTTGPTNTPGRGPTSTATHIAPGIAQVAPTVTVRPSGTPTFALLAPEIGPTTTGTPATPAARPDVLIPVTGADLSEKLNERQALVSRVHQLQTGLNFMGFGLILIGLTLMTGKKEEDWQKED